MWFSVDPPRWVISYVISVFAILNDSPEFRSVFNLATMPRSWLGQGKSADVGGLVRGIFLGSPVDIQAYTRSRPSGNPRVHSQVAERPTLSDRP